MFRSGIISLTSRTKQKWPASVTRRAWKSRPVVSRTACSFQRGRPATGRDPAVTIRLPESSLSADGPARFPAKSASSLIRKKCASGIQPPKPLGLSGPALPVSWGRFLRMRFYWRLLSATAQTVKLNATKMDGGGAQTRPSKWFSSASVLDTRRP